MASVRFPRPRSVKLRPVKANKNSYCGPAVISALTGVDTATAADLVRKATGKEGPVKGMWNSELVKTLAKCGIRANLVPMLEWSRETRATGSGGYGRISLRRPTLAQWFKTFKRKAKDVYLVVAGHHYLLVQGRKYVCGLTREIVGLNHPKVKRRARVANVWLLTK